MAVLLPIIPAGALDERRLRAALRLILLAERADAAADRISGSTDPLAGLRILAGDLTREQQLARITARISLRKRAAGSGPLIHLPDEAKVRDTLGLLLNVGLDVDGERLEDAFGQDSHDIGAGLLRARAAFGDRPIVACREYGWVIGLYRDRALASDERLRLLSHSTSCAVCRDALEQAQRADARLLAALARELEALPERRTPPSAGRARRRVSTVVLAAGSVVVLLALVAGISAIDKLLSPVDRPTPLFADEMAALAPLDGWLLQVSPVGYLEGVNLATGQKRGLDSGDGGNFSPLYRVSKTHIAAWRPSDGQRDDVLTIGPIGDQVKFRLTWNRQFVYWYPSGWLDDDTLLIVKSPDHIAGESEQSYIDRLSTESRLIAFDAVTGTEQVLMTGNVAAAFPSPDGTLLAVLHPFDRRWPGNTLELRPFDGQSVGEPIAQIEHRVVSDGFWLADSSRYVTSVIADQSIAMQEQRSTASLTERGVNQVALEGIARDGGLQTLAVASSPETILPITSSPDGSSIVYQVRAERDVSLMTGVPEYDWRCYQMPSSGGEPTLLTAGDSPERLFKPAWSPDGLTLVLPVARAFPLSPDGAIDQPNTPNATTLLIFGAGWRPGTDPRVLYSSGRDLYGWLAPGALEPRLGMPSAGSRSLAAVVPSEEELDQFSISAESVASGAGAYLVAEARGSRTPVIWNIAGQRSRRLDADITDLTWFNQGQSTIGVASAQHGTGGSRIVLNAADISTSAAYLDHRLFDPAGLGDATDQHYARPLVSPSGTLVSFFVVDRRSGQVSLWLDDQTRPATIVAEWAMPLDRVIEPPIVATWASPSTLLFTRPDDWQDGMPGVAVLMRVVIGSGGEVQLDELTRLDAIRSAQGVSMVELALSPDTTQLAYRLRHFEHATEDSASDDTLHVAGTDDLGRAIEIERGGNGEGLLWTAAGDGLVAGVRDRIALYSPDGRDIEYLSPRGTQSSYPVLIGEQIWFEAVDDRGGSISQVDLE